MKWLYFYFTNYSIFLLINFTKSNLNHTKTFKHDFHLPIWKLGSPRLQVKESKFCFSRDHFYKNFVRQSIPVVVRGLASHWPATMKWSNLSYLESNHGQNLVTTEFLKLAEIGLSEEDFVHVLTLSDFLANYREERLAVDSILEEESSLNLDLKPPTFLRDEDLLLKTVRANLLILNVKESPFLYKEENNKILIQHVGSKTIILYDKKYYREISGNIRSQGFSTSTFSPMRIYLSNFPYLTKIPQYEVTLHKGDMLFIPKYWWQFARHSGDPNIATVYRFIL